MNARYMATMAAIGTIAVLSQLPYAAAQTEEAAEYRPPMRGAPASRVGGGTRGTGDERPRLAVIAPDHTGLTLREQPELYWYVSRPSAARLEITVINDQAVQPLVEKSVSAPMAAGIQRIALADYGVRLSPGVEYRWFVGLVVDAKQRSNDIITSGTIQRIAESPALREKLANADARVRYRLLAQEGVWYDAIAELSARLREQPDNATLKRDFAILLQQVGLKDIANTTP